MTVAPTKRGATVSDVPTAGTSVGESTGYPRPRVPRNTLASASIACPECEGTGLTYTDPPKPCPDCSGTGRFIQPSPEVDDATFVRLEKLSRKAANDSLRAKGGHLAEDQFDSLAVALLAIGIRAFQRFDREMTVSERDGLSFAFRAMRGYRQGRFTEGPYIDWLRTNIRDSRFEPEGSASVTETGVMPETPTLDVESFERAVLDASAKLSNRALWTLYHLAQPIMAEGCPTVTLARRLGMDVQEALDLLDDLEIELRRAA